MSDPFKYSLPSIQAMLSLSSFDMGNAVVCDYIPYKKKGNGVGIARYYTNAKGLAFFKELAANKAKGNMVDISKT